MAEETLRRSLETALDPGLDFPDRLLLSRTMAMLDAQAGTTRQDVRWRSHKPRRLSWRRPGLRLAAILLAVIVAVAATAAFLAAHPFFSRSVPAYPTAPAGTCSVGTRIHMVNATVGWQGDLDRTDWYGGPLRTTDGGLHWRRLPVPPQPGNVTKTGSTSCFLDADHAWVTLNTESGPLVIYRTADGGRTWQSSVPVPGGGRSLFVRLEFIDDQHGWLLNDTGPDISPNTRTIYSTTDGGLHWKQIVKASVGDGSTLGTVAVGCSESGITFIDGEIGWITWDCTPPDIPTRVIGPGQFGPIVASTRDGGRSWQRVRLPTFPTSGTWDCSADPPVLTLPHGVLPVSCPGYGQSAVFSTDDAGRSWSLLRPPVDGELWLQSFVDASVGWALSQATPGTVASAPHDLYRTVNGGRKWVLVTRGLFSGQAVYAFQFVDESSGFALIGVSGTLVKTTNGGQTWSVVPASYS